MICHTVIFRLSGTPEERRGLAVRFRDALMELPAVIEPLESIEVGLNLNPAEDTDIVLKAIVSTMADVDIYARHPAHVAAASIVKGHVAARLCVDSEF